MLKIIHILILNKKLTIKILNLKLPIMQEFLNTKILLLKQIEKVIKKKGDKFYVKWKGYDNSFNSWIDEKDLA